MGHVRVLAFEGKKLVSVDTFAFFTPTARANIFNNTDVTANRVAVEGVVYGAVTNALLLHKADNRFNGFRVFTGVAVKFHIGDVACVGKGVVRGF